MLKTCGKIVAVSSHRETCGKFTFSVTRRPAGRRSRLRAAVNSPLIELTQVGLAMYVCCVDADVTQDDRRSAGHCLDSHLRRRCLSRHTTTKRYITVMSNPRQTGQHWRSTCPADMSTVVFDGRADLYVPSKTTSVLAIAGFTHKARGEISSKGGAKYRWNGNTSTNNISIYLWHDAWQTWSYYGMLSAERYGTAESADNWV